MTNHQRGRLTRAVAGNTRIVGVFAALPLLGMLAVGLGTANAAVLRLSSAVPYLCADVSEAAITNVTPVGAFYCNGDFNQQWEYIDGQFVGIGTTKGVNKCLDIHGAGPNPPGTVVELFDCNGGPNQQWSIFNGALRGLPSSNLIYNPQSGLCLDASGGKSAQLTIERCTGSSSQNWRLE